MKVLSGQVKKGYGVAGKNLSHIVHLIRARTGIGPLVAGTFNLGLSEAHIVHSDAQIEKDDYNREGFIKLQRCRVGGVQALIMRPNTHGQGHAHGPSHIELLSAVPLREPLDVKDGDIVSVETLFP